MLCCVKSKILVLKSPAKCKSFSHRIRFSTGNKIKNLPERMLRHMEKLNGFKGSHCDGVMGMLIDDTPAIKLLQPLTEFCSCQIDVFVDVED